MKKILISLAITLMIHSTVNAQKRLTIWPKIGSLSPEIVFSDVQYFSSKQLNLKSLKGKWVILDFWHKGCSSCMAEFPHLDSIQRQFEEKIKIVLVGYTGSQYHNSPGSDNIHIRKLYDRLKKSHGLSLTIAYDSTSFHQLGVYTPLKIIVDPKGIVRAITYKLSSADMGLFLSGKEPKLPRSWFKNENKVTYDPNQPFLLNNNGGNDTDFLFRSILSEYKDYMRGDNEYKFTIKRNKLQVVGTDLSSLYRFAYTGSGYINYSDSLYGKVAHNPILELNNPTAFKVDRDLRTGIYAYSLIFPPSKSSIPSVMKMVQRDLQNYFGYQANLEIRKMPVWKLVTTEKVKPVSKLPEGTPAYPFDSVNSLLSSIAMYLYNQGPFIDSTGLKGKTDITLNCQMDKLEDVRRALRENGFDLVRDEKEMQVVVIKDSPDENN